MDSHTFLANMVVGLCLVLPHCNWPTTLVNRGYDICGIEWNVGVKGGNVSPDIVITNNATGHALVIDCKSGANIDPEQDRRYGKITSNDLRKAGMPPSIRTHTPIYAINEKHADRIRGHTGHALMVFGSRQVCGIGDFGDAGLTRELCGGVKLSGSSIPDVDTYPFSVRDTHDHIDEYVSRAVLGHLRAHPGIAGMSLATRADASAILRRAHPLHALFSGQHRRELRRAVERSIARQEGRGAWWLGQGARRAIGL